jgi:protoheme IX farnesyltransferase
MADASPVSVAAPQIVPAHRTSLLKAYVELGKIRLNAMVVVTTALGFVVGAVSLYPPTIDYGRLAWTCIGTFFAAMGASAFNQAIEAPRDAKMNRTRRRPVPAGRLSRSHAAFFALMCTIAGIAILCPTSNGLTAVLGLLNVVLYAAVYTPLKPRSTTNTLVGAIVGGIPPIMGWTAATGTITAGAIALGTLLFVWQIPHFLALAWMYREDYARGGYKMVSTADPSGTRTSVLSVTYSLALIIPSLALVYLGHANGLFGFLSIFLACMVAFPALLFAASRSNKDAKRLFLASILYLPLFTLLLILCVQSSVDHMTSGIGGHASKTSEPFINPETQSPQ